MNDGDLEDDPRVQAGVEHLQRAAREVIAATRALLDVAEDLVEDPRSVKDLMGVLGSFGAVAARAARGNGHHAEWDEDPGDQGDDPTVQRIPVS